MSEDEHRSAVREAALAAAPAFHAAGWTWRDNEDPPSVAAIEATLWHLIGNVLRGGPGHSTATGRLDVYYGEDGALHLSLDIGTVYGIATEDGQEVAALLTPAKTGGET